MSKSNQRSVYRKHYLHFNSASLVDAAKAYEDQLANGAKWWWVAGLYSTESWKIFSEIIPKIKYILYHVLEQSLEEDIDL
jgi:deoxyhypusine synthase